MKNTHFISYVIKLVVLLFVTITLVVGNMALPVSSFAEDFSEFNHPSKSSSSEDENKENSESSQATEDTQENSSSKDENGQEDNENGEVAQDSESISADTIEGNGEKSQAEKRALSPARAVSNIWIDGTNDGIRFYDGASKFEAPSRRFNLPDNNNVNKPSRYNYKLRGWYDVFNNKYYEPGALVDLSGSNNYTVFYADWVPENYDIGKNVNTVETADTSSFVNIQLFDYNELFNLGETSRPQVRTTLDGHEIWNAVRQGQASAIGSAARGLIVLDGRQGGGTLAKPGNRPDSSGAYQNKQVSDSGPYPGEITMGLNTRSSDFFKTDDSVRGVTYVGEGNGLFQYDNNPSSANYGYYYYDSTRNAAAYNKSDGRFYVYNYTERTDAANDNSDFLPFNYGSPTRVYDCGDGPSVGQNLPNDANYWFGMKTNIDFFLPDDSNRFSGSGNVNQAIGNKDMVYRFSGDDDVWVMVDDELVLDLGGIHHIVSGEINFSTGVVTTRDRNNRVQTYNFNFKSGDHKLTMYYMERGASQSNCSLYFNIAPRYGLDIIKKDADDPNELLKGAVFGIYTDRECTVPAVLWEDEESCKRGDDSTNIFTTDESGHVSCYGMYANRTYYLKEMSSPSGYPSISDKVFILSLDKTGNATLSGDTQDVVTMAQDGATKTIHLNVTNRKPEDTSVNVEKKWYNEDGSPVTDNVPTEIKVQLYRSTVESQGGESSGTRVPINFTTQYFGTGNGSNTDSASPTIGDYTLSKTAIAGGKVEFTVDVTKDSAGIYAVTANGRPLTPHNPSGHSTTNCHIGGKWGVYPYQKATYVIDPITESTEIRVMLIGYLEYGGNPWHADVSYSMKPIDVSITQPESTVTPTVPSVKPDDAEPVGDPIILNESSDWKGAWDGLPTTDSDGKTYYYYVEELPVEGYSTSYTGNGTVGGTVTVTNVRLREIIVKKLWKNAAGSDMTEGMPDSIQAALIQSDKTTNQSKEIAFTLNQGNQWTKRWRSDDSALGEQKDHVYEYRVKELDSLEGYEAPVYTNNDGISEGTITITNKKILYRLPDAGGSGTYLFVFLGSFMIVLALALIGKGRKTRRGRGRMALKTLAVLALSVSLMPQGVFAASPVNDVPDIDTSTPRSLTVEYTYGGTPIRDTEFLLCKIADLSVKDRSAKYTFTGDFSSEGGFPNDLSARESGSLAKRLYSMVLSGTAQTISGKTDSSGRLVFSDLSPGMYLIAQTAEKNLSGKRYSSDPFLASVPQPVTNEATGQTEWRYAVTVSPKAAGVKNSEKPKKPDTPKKDTPNNIKTGDPSNLRFYGVLLILSAAALSLLIIFYRRRRGS